MSVRDHMCIACMRPAANYHHVLPQSKIKVYARGMKRDGINVDLPKLLLDSRNLVPMCFDCHQGHENWSRRLSREQVPVGAWEFARELGDWATYTLERSYPVRRAA